MPAREAIDTIRTATRGTDYESKLFLVGGYVRDKLLGLPIQDDLDIVLEGDGVALARFLFEKGICDHAPVVYPRFGTAKTSVNGVSIEIVGARAESYEDTSRKPMVSQATLLDDAKRRDFTVNTLLENLHTGEIADPLGRARKDLKDGLIITPLEPEETFSDDPLRMLRAIRFAVRLDFQIAPECEEAIRHQTRRLKIVSGERIRDEFTKMLLHPNAGTALRWMQRLGLLAVFAPELEAMVGVTQNWAHIYDVWEHTVVAIEALPDDASLAARLGVLLHDIGKPMTKTTDDKGEVHFYDHQTVGLEPAGKFLRRQRFPNDVSDSALKLVALHMRPGGYRTGWSDGAVRRLVRDAGEDLQDLFIVCRADSMAHRPDALHPDYDGLEARIQELERQFSTQKAESPLTGQEIMDRFDIEPGPAVGRLKSLLEEAVLEGSLKPGDKEAAWALLASQSEPKSR